jgi:transposase InsO family protein
MHETRKAMNSGRLKELDVQEREDGLLVIVGRAQTGLLNLYGTSSLPVIMGNILVAELIMTSAHWKDHTGQDITMAMSRMEAWIVNARKLAKHTVRKCVRCRYLRKKLEGQKMAVLPDLMQIPSRPFTNIGVDLCGPITVKCMANKRATMKAWVSIFLCLNTKAVSMELAPGYSTDDFMLAYETHCNCRGIPSFVYSDRGSQLVAAQKELSDDPLKYDWDSIASKALKRGTKWDFTPPGAQWRNGATESFVKKFKHSFHHLYSDTRLNYAELVCAIKRIANILNNRPISVQRTKTDAQDEDFLHPLTPNMLIMMGNSGVNPPSVIEPNDEDPRVRFSFISEIERAWWYQYKVQYFQSLMPTRKWIEKQRNMCPGDVVLIEYKSKSLPGTYRLGRVRDVEVDQHDKLVRTCTVVYKLIKPVTDINKNSVNDVVTKEIRVPVQRLVLILPVEEQ